MHTPNRLLRFSAALLLPAWFLLLSASLLPLPASAQSQTSATIQGTITDTSDAAISGVKVILQETPAKPAAKPRETVSSADGSFRFDVPPGRYRLTVAHASLRTYTQEVSLAAGERRELRIPLAIETLASTVIVSAQALPEPADAVSAPVDILTRRKIDERQAVALAPLLQTLPGVNLTQTGPAGGTVSLFVDGGKSSYTKVLVDGVPMNDPGGAFDFSNLTPDNVDKVELVHGAQSALAGSDAMTGTIEILSHRGTTREPLGVVETEGGSFGTARGMAQLSGAVGRFDYSAATGYFQTQGQGPNDHFINRTWSGNFGLRINPHDTLRLTLRSYSSDAGEPGQTLYQPPNLDQHNTLHNLSSGLTWEFSTGRHWQHRVFASETDIHQLYQNPLADFYTANPAVTCPFPLSSQAVQSNFCDFTYVTRNQYNRVNAQVESSYVARQGAITAGYWYEVENGFPGDLGGVHARRNNMAGFLDGRWQASGRLLLNAGVRIEDNSNFGTRAVPRAGAAYVLRYGNDQWGPTRLRFSFGEGIKEPSLDQSFGTDPCDPGNRSLHPEQSRTINAGIEQGLAHNNVAVSADYFDNRFRDVISAAFCFPGGPCPVTPPPGCPFGFFNYFNTDLARARGAHLRVQAKMTRRLSLTGNYTYDDSRVLAAPNAFDPTELPGNRLFRQPVNSGSLVLNVGFGRLQGTLTGVFVGRRTDSDFLGLGFTSNPGYFRLDLAFLCRLTTAVSLTGRVQNLTNERYQDVLGFPALGVAAYGGLRLRFGGRN